MKLKLYQILTGLNKIEGKTNFFSFSLILGWTCWWKDWWYKKCAASTSQGLFYRFYIFSFKHNQYFASNFLGLMKFLREFCGGKFSIHLQNFQTATCNSALNFIGFCLILCLLHTHTSFQFLIFNPLPLPSNF